MKFERLWKLRRTATRGNWMRKTQKGEKGRPVPRSRRLTETSSETRGRRSCRHPTDKIRSFSSAKTCVSRFLTASDLEGAKRTTPTKQCCGGKKKSDQSTNGVVFMFNRTTWYTCSDAACSSWEQPAVHDEPELSLLLQPSPCLCCFYFFQAAAKETAGPARRRCLSDLSVMTMKIQCSMQIVQCYLSLLRGEKKWRW